MINLRALLIAVLFFLPTVMAGQVSDIGDTVKIDSWKLFSYVDMTKVEMADIKTLPEFLPGVGEVLIRGISVEPDGKGLIDIAKITGGFRKKACAMLFAEVFSETPRTMRIGTSADWWMQVRINGELALSTLDFGNNRYYLGKDRNRLTDYVLDLPLKAGKNLIAIKVLAGSKAWYVYAGNDADVQAAKAFKFKRISNYIDRPLEYIQDEDSIAPYKLPELLKLENGTVVSSVEQWEQLRRPEILAAFNRSIYGEIPRSFDNISFKTIIQDDNCLNGLAVRKKVLITVVNNGRSLEFPLWVFIPKRAEKPVPVVMFILRATPEDRRGFRPDSNYWPIRRLLENGFAAASFDRNIIAADNPEHFKEGVLSLYPEHTARPDGWRTISAWAYGAMRSIDYFVGDPDIDNDKIIVAGHSRGGKTALWTAANDTRVSMAIVNGSGCLGASLSRRKIGEHLPFTNLSNPHWFNDNYHGCKDENDLPVDQHMLVALVAPRAICIGDGIGDPEADPKGSYLSLIGADGAYQLYGLESLAAKGQPRIEKPVTAARRSYHIRYGNHDMTYNDWGIYIEMAKREFKLAD